MTGSRSLSKLYGCVGIGNWVVSLLVQHFNYYTTLATTLMTDTLHMPHPILGQLLLISYCVWALRINVTEVNSVGEQLEELVGMDRMWKYKGLNPGLLPWIGNCLLEISGISFKG